MEQKTHEWYEHSDRALDQLMTGAFLTTKKGDKVNTMTIAWGGINVIWGRPVFVVYVRYSRDTYDMLEDNDEFTISIPTTADLRKELAYCGSRSGRDTNKIEDCDLMLVPGRKVKTPVLGDCDLHYECKIIYRQAMEANMVPNDVKERYYKTNNYHMIYYGEIIDSYQIKGVK